MQNDPTASCVMVIFGAGGDLTRRELIPSLFELHRKQLLPMHFAMVGFSYGDWNASVFREEMRLAVEQSCGSAAGWNTFAPRLSFIGGDATSGDDYVRLATEIARVRAEFAIPMT